MGCILIFVQPFGWQLHSLYQSLLQPVLFLSLFKKYSSYFWLLWVLVVACGNFIAPRRLLSSCDTGAQELPHTGLVAVGGMWDLSSPQFSSVLLLSRVRLFATPWTAARQASLSITNSRSSPKLFSIESVMPSLVGIKPVSPASRGGFFLGWWFFLFFYWMIIVYRILLFSVKPQERWILNHWTTREVSVLFLNQLS